DDQVAEQHQRVGDVDPPLLALLLTGDVHGPTLAPTAEPVDEPEQHAVRHEEPEAHQQRDEEHQADDVLGIARRLIDHELDAATRPSAPARGRSYVRLTEPNRP